MVRPAGHRLADGSGQHGIHSPDRSFVREAGRLELRAARTSDDEVRKRVAPSGTSRRPIRFTRGTLGRGERPRLKRAVPGYRALTALAKFALGIAGGEPIAGEEPTSGEIRAIGDPWSLPAVRGYKPRRPKAPPLFRWVQEHLHRLQTVFDERFVRDYGSWHTAILPTQFPEDPEC